jgi:ferredoxin
MHTVGVIPKSSAGWTHQLAGRASDGVVDGATPFRHDRDFQALYKPDVPIEFTRKFDLTKAETARSKAFLLNIESAATDLMATINGKTIELKKLDAREAKQKGWNYEAMLSHTNEKMPEMLPGEAAPQALLRSGGNEIAIRLTLGKSTYGETLLDVGLTGYLPPTVDNSVAGEEYKQDWVMKTAVVCDMCSGQFGKQPACVNACPHEAAQRRFVTYDAFLPTRK